MFKSPFDDMPVYNNYDTSNMTKALATYYYQLDKETELLAACIKQYCALLETVVEALNSPTATNIQKKDLLVALDLKSKTIYGIMSQIATFQYKISVNYGK